MAGKTLYDKLWDSHLVKQRDDGSALIYIDRHIIHEVTSPQAFAAMLDAIGRAERSILLETYIFDRDAVGERWPRHQPLVDD